MMQAQIYQYNKPTNFAKLSYDNLYLVINQKMNNIEKPQKQQPILQGENPQLQDPPLKIEMDPTNLKTSKFKNKQSLETVISNCLLKIEEMSQTVKTNEKLQKYFLKAGTNSKQIFVVLQKLEQDLIIIKQSLSHQNVNLSVIAEIMVFMEQILKKNDIAKMQHNIQKAIWIVEFESKVICSMQFIMKSLYIPHDITTLSKQNFKQVWESIKIEKFGDSKKIKQSLDFTKRIMAITTSAVINENECTWAIMKLVNFGLSYPQYYLSTKQGQLRSMIFYRRPTIQLANKIWNLPENGMTRQISKLGMKSIETNFKIYIPFDAHTQPKDITVDDGKSIQVRVLHNDVISFKQHKKKPKFSFCVNSHIQDQNHNDIETIILHVHGGGFLALSSRSMQVYTRRWARQLKIPVLSIDYRMPPDHRFPTAPLDCLAVYRFLISHIHKYLNIRPRKIILAGDSAGGNLVFSLTGLILREKLPTPYGIYAAYPACDLRKIFSPSKIYAFTDPLLNPSMLLLCLKQYLGGKEQFQTDPIASPIFLTQQYVGGHHGDKRFPVRWPKTIIQVGAEDPLLDDSLKMMERMKSSKIDCQCQIYENLSHGFLNLQFVIPDCLKTIKDSIVHLQKLLK